MNNHHARHTPPKRPIVTLKSLESVQKKVQKELQKHTASKVLVSMLDVEVDLVGDLRPLGSLSRPGTEKCGDGDNR